jgi:hypothetical protein
MSVSEDLKKQDQELSEAITLIKGWPEDHTLRPGIMGAIRESAQNATESLGGFTSLVEKVQEASQQARKTQGANGELHVLGMKIIPASLADVVGEIVASGSRPHSCQFC